MCIAAASSAARIFLFGKFSNFLINCAAFSLFFPSFHRYLDFPRVKNGSISQNSAQIYLSENKCKHTLYCDGINYSLIDDKYGVCQYRHIKGFKEHTGQGS